MIHRLKIASMTVSSWQKLSEMRHWNFKVLESREKWMSLYDIN